MQPGLSKSGSGLGYPFYSSSPLGCEIFHFISVYPIILHKSGAHKWLSKEHPDLPLWTLISTANDNPLIIYGIPLHGPRLAVNFHEANPIRHERALMEC